MSDILKIALGVFAGCGLLALVGFLGCTACIGVGVHNAQVEEENRPKPSLAIEELSDSIQYERHYVRGKVRNTGPGSATFVRVKVELQDGQGGVVNTAWTYANSTVPLESGEAVEWEVSAEADRRIERYVAKIISFK
ncbi:MAG: FxLYD domain-containing protein [Acidobacteriota bacterium]